MCAGFLAVLAMAIGFICYRHSRNRTNISVPQLKDEEEAVELLDVPTPGRSPDMTDFRAVHVRRDEGMKRKLNGHGPTGEDEDEGRTKILCLGFYSIFGLNIKVKVYSVISTCEY